MADMNTGTFQSFLKTDHKDIEKYIERVSDSNLQETLNFGIGMHHAGLISEVK